MTMDPHDPHSIKPPNIEQLQNAWIRLVEVSIEKDFSVYPLLYGIASDQLLYAAAPSHICIVPVHRYGNIVIDGLLYPLHSDTVHIIRPGQRVELNAPPGGKQFLYLFHFEIWIRGEHAPASNFAILGPEVASVSSSIVQLMALCKKVADHWRTGDPADRFASQAGFQDILHLIFRKSSPSEAMLDQAHEYIKHHYRNEITIEQLAESAGMNRYSFMRAFKERFGQSVMGYLAEVRTNQAKQLMEEGYSLQHVADETGYKDALYFSSQFKKHVGFSPKIYQANRQSKVAAYSWPNIDHLLALQIIPFAAPIDHFWTQHYRNKYRFDVKVVLSHDYDFNREALMRARPDRIVALAELVPDEEKEKLLQIAPVLFLPWFEENWRGHLRLTAQFLNREREGENWLAQYDDKVQAVREKVPDFFRRGTLLILNVSPKGIRIWGERAGTVLYDDLQFNCAKGVEQIKYTQYMESFDAEPLTAFEADMLLVNVMKDRQSQMGWERLQQSQAWQELKAVQNHRVYCISGNVRTGDPIVDYTAYQQNLLLHELDMLFREL